MQRELYVPALRDDLLNSTFYQEGLSRDARVNKVRDCSELLRRVVLEDWDDGSQWVHHLTAAKLLAGEPAVWAVANADKVTQPIASEVRSNFSTLARYLIENRYTSTHDSTLNGEVTECAILGLIWWSIEHGYFTEGSYVRPATTQQDASNSRGLKNGFDALLCMPKGKKNKLQFKRKGGETKSYGYESDITVISPERLTKPKGQKITTNMIVHALSFNNSSFLADASEALQEIILPKKALTTGIFDASKYKGRVQREFTAQD